MFRLILFGMLWLMAIAMITFAAFQYFDNSQQFSFKKEMWELKNGEE